MSPRRKQGEVWQGTLSIMVLETLKLLGPQPAYGLARLGETS